MRLAGRSSDGDDVLCLQAFLTLHHLELDFLPLGQTAPARPVGDDGAEVDKDVGTALALDEAEALLVIEPFDSASFLIAHFDDPRFESTIRASPGAAPLVGLEGEKAP